LAHNPMAVARINDLSGGEIVGNTRLQKSTYFLESWGIGFGFGYTYHYYGPFSEELRDSSEDAVELGLIRQVPGTTKSGNTYYTYQCIDKPEADPDLDDKRRSILSVTGQYDSICLEIAATADYLRQNGFDKSFWDETAARKSSKCTPETIAAAKELLGKLENLRD